MVGSGGWEVPSACVSKAILGRNPKLSGVLSMRMCCGAYRDFMECARRVSFTLRQENIVVHLSRWSSVE